MSFIPLSELSYLEEKTPKYDFDNMQFYTNFNDSGIEFYIVINDERKKSWTLCSTDAYSKHGNKAEFNVNHIRQVIYFLHTLDITNQKTKDEKNIIKKIKQTYENNFNEPINTFVEKWDAVKCIIKFVCLVYLYSRSKIAKEMCGKKNPLQTLNAICNYITTSDRLKFLNDYAQFDGLNSLINIIFKETDFR